MFRPAIKIYRKFLISWLFWLFWFFRGSNGKRLLLLFKSECTFYVPLNKILLYVIGLKNRLDCVLKDTL